MLQFCRASHVGSFALHVSTAEEMLPYISTAGHPTHARCGCLYVDWMKGIPRDLYQAFMNGVSCISRQVLSNGIWTDQSIEFTWMRNSHGPLGFIGLTSNEVWSLNAAVCGQIRSQVKMMGNEGLNYVQMECKEEITIVLIKICSEVVL